MLAFSNDYYGMIFRATQSVELFCAYDDLIALLDIFPMYLPARFYDRYSVYEYVYLLSVLPLEKQYQDIQRHFPQKWNALINKINKIIEIKETGEVIEHAKERYFIYD